MFLTLSLSVLTIVAMSCDNNYPLNQTDSRSTFGSSKATLGSSKATLGSSKATLGSKDVRCGNTGCVCKNSFPVCCTVDRRLPCGRGEGYCCKEATSCCGNNLDWKKNTCCSHGFSCQRPDKHTNGWWCTNCNCHAATSCRVAIKQNCGWCLLSRECNARPLCEGYLNTTSQCVVADAADFIIGLAAKCRAGRLVEAYECSKTIERTYNEIRDLVQEATHNVGKITPYQHKGGVECVNKSRLHPSWLHDVELAFSSIYKLLESVVDVAKVCSPGLFHKLVEDILKALLPGSDCLTIGKLLFNIEEVIEVSRHFVSDIEGEHWMKAGEDLGELIGLIVFDSGCADSSK